MNLSIVIGVVAILLALFWKKIKNRVSGVSATHPKTVKIVLGILIYIAILQIIRFGIPAYWETWHTPEALFWWTNIGLWACIIAASQMPKIWWGVRVATGILIFVFLYCTTLTIRTAVKEHKSEQKAEQVRQDSLLKANPIEDNTVHWIVSGDGYATAKNPLPVIYFPRKTKYRVDSASVVKIVSLETNEFRIVDGLKIYTNDVTFNTGESGKCMVYPVGTTREWFSVKQVIY